MAADVREEVLVIFEEQASESWSGAFKYVGGGCSSLSHSGYVKWQ